MSFHSVLTLVVCSVLLVGSRRYPEDLDEDLDYGELLGRTGGRYEGEEEEDDNPYHNKKLERLYAYEDEGEGADDTSFMSVMSTAGASAAGVTTAGVVALAGGPVAIAISVVGVAVTASGLSWDWDGIGIAWPDAKWKNPMTLNLASETKAWVWTEEGSGRVFSYEYPNRATAISKAMNEWWCARILVTWNRDELKVDFEDKRGMTSARSTIMSVANGAYLNQFKENVEDLMIYHAITQADIEQ